MNVYVVLKGVSQMSTFVYKGGGRGQKWAKICLRGLWKPPYFEFDLLFSSIFNFKRRGNKTPRK